MKISHTKILDLNALFWGTSFEMLMEHAGTNAAQYLIEHFSETNTFQFFCGSGNNGGDGYVSVRKLLEQGKNVEVYIVQESKTEIAKKNFDMLPKEIFKSIDEFCDNEENVIVDCILGVGVEGSLKEDICRIVKKLNTSKGYKVSYDVSTGGQFKADVVLSFHESKKENKTFKEVVIPMGMPKEAEMYFGPGDVFAYFPRRRNFSHKGENGKLLIIGGSEYFHGAPLLSVLGAQAIGVDLIMLFVPTDQKETVRNFSPELIVKTFQKNYLTVEDVKYIIEVSQEMDACIIGPGLGKNKETEKAVITLLNTFSIPCVIDADAILEEKKYKNISINSIFTPHDGEFQRLFGYLFSEKTLKHVMKSFSSTLLKKGEIDVIVSGENIKENHTGSPVLSRGGTGDMLSGMCGAFLARGVETFYAAGMASFLLGFAGELCEKKYGEGFSLKLLGKEVSLLVKDILEEKVKSRKLKI